MLLLCGKPFSVSSPLHVIYRLVVSAGDAVGDFTSIHLSHLLSYTPPCQLCPSHHGHPPSPRGSSCLGLCYALLLDSLCGWPLPFLEV